MKKLKRTGLFLVILIVMLNVLNIFTSNVYAVYSRDEGYSQEGAEQLKERVDSDKESIWMPSSLYLRATPNTSSWVR